MNYLQVPISVSYRFPVSDNVKIDFNAGPYVACDLGGKLKESYASYFEDEGSYEMKVFGSKSKALCKRFDAGLRFGAGVHIQRVILGLIYDLGLTNIANSKGSEGSKGSEDYSDDYSVGKRKIKNGSSQISLGYNF